MKGLRRGLILLFSIWNISYGFSQGDIDYKSKVLLKVLQKNSIGDFSNLSEIENTRLAKDVKKINGKFFETNNNQYKYIYVGRVNSCRAGGCSLSNNNIGDENPEYFDYFILFDDKKTVQLVRVFNYQATHGQEICSKGWLKQFIGFNGDDTLIVDKEIDAISGATISVYAITADVDYITKLLDDLK